MGNTSSRQLTAIHANDPEWIIRLWIAIHGGDPAPLHDQGAISKASTGIIKALIPHLDPAKQKAVTAALG